MFLALLCGCIELKKWELFVRLMQDGPVIYEQWSKDYDYKDWIRRVFDGIDAHPLVRLRSTIPALIQ